jgi:hypothetical protein
MLVRILALAILLSPGEATAEWQIKPFAAVAFGGSTTYVDPEQAAGTRNFVMGVSGVFLGEVLGLEADFGHAPGFFESNDPMLDDLVARSSVTTFTGNVVLAVPRRLAQYSLRPYFVAGFGLIRSRLEPPEPAPEVLRLAESLPAFDVGGGVTGFLSERIGVSWDLRHFRSVDREPGAVLTVLGADKHVSFWRASMALAFRY